MKQENEKPIKTVCAWCGKIMIENLDTPKDRISHGLCSTCKVKMIEKIDSISNK